MAGTPRRPKSSILKINQHSHKEINILVLGQTGIEKTTCINSFANYLV
jgi:septin family protein